MAELTGTEASGEQPIAPPAPEETQPVDRLGEELLRSLAPELRPVVEEKVEPTADDGDPDEDADDEGEDGDTPEAVEKTEKPQRTVEEWEAYVAENPGRINEAPRSVRRELYRRAVETREQAVKQAETTGYQAGQSEAERLAKLRAAVADVEELTEAEYGALVRQNPAVGAAYQEAKRQLAAAENGQQVDASMAEALMARAKRTLSQLAGHSEAAAAIAAKYPNGASLTLDGIIDLEVSVRDALSREGETAAKARQEAAAANRAKPKALPVGGGGQGELTRDAIKAMTPEQIIELRKTEGGAARIERALAGP